MCRRIRDVFRCLGPDRLRIVIRPGKRPKAVRGRSARFRAVHRSVTATNSFPALVIQVLDLPHRFPLFRFEGEHSPTVLHASPPGFQAVAPGAHHVGYPNQPHKGPGPRIHGLQPALRMAYIKEASASWGKNPATSFLSCTSTHPHPPPPAGSSNPNGIWGELQPSAQFLRQNRALFPEDHDTTPATRPRLSAGPACTSTNSPRPQRARAFANFFGVPLTLFFFFFCVYNACEPSR